LTDASVYTKDSGSSAAAYPQVDLRVPIYVVGSILSSDGVGGSRTTTANYGGAKAHSVGRGFLGFRWNESVDSPTGLKVRTEYRQDWPYVGLPLLVKKTQNSSALLSQMTNTFSCINPSSGAACAVAAGNRYFPYVSQSAETGNDLNGAVLPTVTTTNAGMDVYGNVGTITVSTGDGYSKATTNTYTNDALNWILGRLTRSTVQSTAP
jgi:hypothetical protein